MRRDVFTLIDFATLVLLCVVVLFMYDDIMVMINEVMAEQADSFEEQLIR